jgi:hypothetical protein
MEGEFDFLWINVRWLSGMVIENRCAVSIRASRLIAAEWKNGLEALG